MELLVAIVPSAYLFVSKINWFVTRTQNAALEDKAKHTIYVYRQYCLLIRFATNRLHPQPSKLVCWYWRSDLIVVASVNKLCACANGIRKEKKDKLEHMPRNIHFTHRASTGCLNENKLNKYLPNAIQYVCRVSTSTTRHSQVGSITQPLNVHVVCWYKTIHSNASSALCKNNERQPH